MFIEVQIQLKVSKSASAKDSRGNGRLFARGSFRGDSSSANAGLVEKGAIFISRGFYHRLPTLAINVMRPTFFPFSFF